MSSSIQDVTTLGKEHALKLDAILFYISSVPNLWYTSLDPQLGLYYLAQYAVDNGYHVKVETYDGQVPVIDQIVKNLADHECHIAGFNLNHENIWTVKRIASRLKAKHPGLHIILGGPELTGDPKRAMEHVPDATCGVIGEGETTFVQLLSLPSLSAETLATCDGVIFKSGKDGSYTITPEGEPVDLDRVSIAKRNELTLSGKYQGLPGMVTGRGCVGQCAFCYEGVKRKKKIRLQSTAKCIEEFSYLADNFIDSEDRKPYITILDDTFIASPTRAREFCQEIIKKYQGRIKWFCEARVDTLCENLDLIPLMIEAGMIRIQLGGESGSQEILDIYNKKTTLAQMETVIQALYRAGMLSVFINFIIGGAFETRETFQKTLDFALKLIRLAPGCVDVGASYFTSYPGTPMALHPEEYGIRIFDGENVMGKSDHTPSVKTEALSHFELNALYNQFHTAVNIEMQQLAKDLKKEQMERIYYAFNVYGIRINWYGTLASLPLLHNYLNASSFPGYLPYHQVKAMKFQEVYPTRTMYLVTSANNNYLIKLHKSGYYEPDKLEKILLELSYGKLSFYEIIDILNEQLPEVDREILLEKVIAKYDFFDKHFFMIWKLNV